MNGHDSLRRQAAILRRRIADNLERIDAEIERMEREGVEDDSGYDGWLAEGDRYEQT